MDDPEEVYRRTVKGRRWGIITKVTNIAFLFIVFIMVGYGIYSYYGWVDRQWCECPDPSASSFYQYYDPLPTPAESRCRCYYLEYEGITYGELTFAYIFLAPILVGAWMGINIMDKRRADQYIERYLAACQGISTITGGKP